jgi:hypothetical protein
VSAVIVFIAWTRFYSQADDDFAESQRANSNFAIPTIYFSGHRNRKNILAPEVDIFEHGGDGHVNSALRQAHLYPSSLHPPFILPSSSLHPPFILPSSSLHPPFILPSSSLHPPFILPSSSLHPPFILILPSSSLHPPFILPSSSLHPPFILPSSSLHPP